MRKSSSTHIDKPLLLILLLLVLGGCLISTSAAFGLVARGATNISSVMFSHLVMGVALGTVFLSIMATVDYHFWRRYAPHLFVLAIIGTLLVFVPHVGMAHGGGKRWIVLAGMSFQPSEALKLASIILAAAYFAAIKGKVATLKYGVGGVAAILALPVLILLLQPDLGTLGVVCSGVVSIFIAAGARWRDLAIAFCVGILLLALLAIPPGYVHNRVTTFVNPSQGQQGASYQLKQSLIAIGSGGITGRGLGQGIQKFTYLPEPMGDSIYAVAGEELGFIGTVTIILAYLAFVLRGYNIATKAIDPFGSLLAVGISTYLVAEAFINIASMIGVAPLTGIPLTFISQGGSAMLVSLASAGLLLGVSRYKKVVRF